VIGRYAPPRPTGVSSPAQWGDTGIIQERLGAAVKDIVFARDAMMIPALSAQHYRIFMEQNLGPMTRLLQWLDNSDPNKASGLRREFEDLAAQHFERNIVRQDYLMTRGVKV
jgi:hypothetical protein